MDPRPALRSVRSSAYLYEHMFPTTPTSDPARRSLAELLQDAMATAIEFATLGEATLDPAAATKVRYMRPSGAAAVAPFAHPHRVALRRPSRPRRPGTVPPRVPVCTMPIGPAGPTPAPAPAAARSQYVPRG